MADLAFYSLALLGLVPLAGVFDLDFWEIVRILGVAAGLVWLLLRQRRGKQVPWGEFLLSLVYMFVLTQFAQEGGGRLLSFVGALLVGLAFIGVCSAGRAVLSPLTRLDRGVLLLGGLAVLASLVIQLVFGPESGQLRSERWLGTGYILELLLLYLAVSRLLRGPRGAQRESRLLAVTAAVFLLVGLVGVWRIGVTYYFNRQAVAEFAAGRYDQAANYVARLHLKEKELDFAPLGVVRTVEKMSETARRIERVETWMGLGGIADQEELWYIAQQAYQRVYQQNPSYPAVCAHLGLALFERAKTDSAMALLHQGAAQREASVEDHLALAMALARTAAWGEANQALDSALVMSGLKVELARRVRNGKVDGEPGVLLPPLYMRYALKLSLFDVARLLESRGWKVLHPAMEIGQTGVKTPVDIAVYSGGAASFWKEDIVVGERGVSLRKRGYNLAVIEPKTGSLDTVAWFDQSATRRVTDFLSRIPEGRIVAGSANEDIAMSMTEEVGRELARLGGNPSISLGWSYALIGVKGAGRGEGVEAVSNRSLVVAGVLGANIAKEVAEDPVRLEAVLQDAARTAPAGIAVFLPGLESNSRLIAVQR